MNRILARRPPVPPGTDGWAERMTCLNEHEIERVRAGAEALMREIDEHHEQQDDARVMVNYKDDDGDDREEPWVWSERRSNWMKLGMIEAARLDIHATFEGDE